MEIKNKIRDIKADLSIRWYGFKWNLEQKAKATLNWCSNNKELTIAFLTAAGVAIRTVSKTTSSISRKIDDKKETDRRDLEIYDHSIGKWHKLKRPMKYDETIEFDERKRKGQSTVSILDDMGLLRR